MFDLTLPLDDRIPTFPGYPGFQSERIDYFPEDHRRSHTIRLNTHLGTHVDGPAHFLENGDTVDRIDPDTLIGPARVVDLRKHRGEVLTADTLEAAAPDLGAERVLLLTGDVDLGFYDDDFFEKASVLSSDAADWLVDRDVTLVANDFLTEGVETDRRPVHRTLLGADIPIVEYLCNVDSVIDFESVYFVCLPLLLSGLEASPVRAVADRPGSGR